MRDQSVSACNAEIYFIQLGWQHCLLEMDWKHLFEGWIWYCISIGNKPILLCLFLLLHFPTANYSVKWDAFKLFCSLIKKLIESRVDFQSYVQWNYRKWSVCLSTGAIIQGYSIHVNDLSAMWNTKLFSNAAFMYASEIWIYCILKCTKCSPTDIFWQQIC